MSRVARAAAILLAGAVAAEAAVAQEPGVAEPSAQPGFELRSNYPNPFDPETTIPYTLDEGLFAGEGSVVVTVRIFDLFAQPVAHPVALDHPAGAVAVRSLEYTTPGQHEAFWDGTDDNGAQVAAGVYMVKLTVNDQSLMRRIVRTSDGLRSGGFR